MRVGSGLIAGTDSGGMRIEVPTSERFEVVDVTDEISAAIPSEVEAGVCLLTVPHTTASVVLNENEPGLRSDVERLVPREVVYAHDAVDDNAAADLRATRLGASVSIPVEGGELACGTWQSVLFGECDGPRSRRLRVTTTSR